MTDLRLHPMTYGFRGREIVYEPGDDPTVTERFARCPNCEQWSPCDVRKSVQAATSPWRRFDKDDETTWPDEDKDYVVIGEDDMLCTLKGRHNYFVRQGTKIYVELPPLPDWYINEDEA